jgi:predicted RNA-binding protein with PUA-like domain
MARSWLFKTEPSTYSFEDLVHDGRTVWDGVKNPVAQKNLRSAKTGDRVLVYHTGDVKAAVGLARIVKDPFPDPKAGDPKLVAVELASDGPLAGPVTLAAMKANRALAGFDLLRLPRLSVVPVDDAQWKTIVEMSAGA